jgi:hypothetical protein
MCDCRTSTPRSLFVHDLDEQLPRGFLGTGISIGYRASQTFQ